MPVAETENAAEPLAVSASSAAATVTACGTSQFAAVNVNSAGVAPRSASPDERTTVTTTSDVGALASFTVNPSLAPSATVNPSRDTTSACGGSTGPDASTTSCG